MMRIFNKNGPLCKNKNNGSNLIVNKNRALCEGKTFKAFTSNALLIALLMLIVMLIPNIVRAEERSIDGVSYTYNVVNGNEAEIITIYPMGSGVTEVIIPNEIEGKTVTSISQDAFRVWNVTKLTIPGTVNTIRQYTFSGLKKLTTVNILDGVTSIGKSAFSGCTALTSITIPNSITSIGDGAFSGCTALESITIPNSVTSIGVWAFSECTALESITILNGVKYIGNEAFVNCYSLSTIEIPESVISIGYNAFYNCIGLTNILVNNNNENYCSVRGVLFNKDMTKIICYPKGKEESEYYIPAHVTDIGEYAFEGCEVLTQIIFSNNINNIERAAFYGCTGLTEVQFPDKVTSIGDFAFSYCTSLEGIDIWGEVGSIGSSVFEGCTNLKEIVLSGNIEIIEPYAFSYLEGLERLEISGKVETIEGEAFSGNESLEKIEIYGEIENIMDCAFACNTNLSNLQIWGKVNNIEGYPFYDCASLTNIYIPEETVVSYDFVGNSDANIKTIVKFSFNEDGTIIITNVLKSEESFMVPTTILDTPVVIVKGLAFNGLDYLTQITVEEDNEYYFSSEDGILFSKDETELIRYPIGKQDNTYIIPETVTTIEESAFVGCNNLTDIIIPNTVTQIKESAFEGYLGLTSLKISEEMISIEKNAFKGCTNLQYIEISSSLTEGIDNEAFTDCENAIIICRPNSYAHKYAIKNDIDFRTVGFDAEIEYSTKQLTNEDVIVIITINEKLSDECIEKIEEQDWFYSEEELTLTKTYTQNIEEELILTDWLNNQKEVVIRIENIDNVSPTLNILYTPNELTEENVTVMINADEQILRDVIIVENGEEREEEWGYLFSMIKTTLVKTFDTNKTFTIQVKDLAGNYSEPIEINVNKILPIINNLEITPNTLTNENVKIIVNVDEKYELAEYPYSLDGENWVDNNELEVETNDTYTVYVKDALENINQKQVQVTNIDKQKPVIITQKTPTDLTNGNVTITITANEEISNEVKITTNEGVRKEEWNVSELYEKTITKTFEGNTTFTLEVKDLAGNYSEPTEIIIDNIRKELEIPQIQYIPVKDELTNEDVTAIINFINSDEIVIINNDGNNTYTFESNGIYTFYYEDIAGNKGKIEVVVDWIDKDMPIINGVEEGKTYIGETVTPTIVEENIREVKIIKNNEEEIDYEEGMEIKEIGTYTIVVEDRAGNKTEVNFTIEEDPEKPEEDKECPKVEIQITNKDRISKTKEVTINITEEGSGLNEENRYEYTLTKDTEEENWKPYEIGETFEVGENLTGEYYLVIREIKDNVGNETRVEPIKLVFDNTKPIVKINGTEEIQDEYETIIITVEEDNNYEIVVKKGEETIEYEEGEELDRVGTYKVEVTDEAGNNTERIIRIRRYIILGKYRAYEEEGTWYLIDVQPETVKEQFIENLETDIEGIEVIKLQNKENEEGEEQEEIEEVVLEDGNYVATNMKVRIEETDYVIVVRGDCDGTGTANFIDMLKINKHRINKVKLEGAFLKAGDVNDDGEANFIDMLKINKFRLGKVEIL